MTGRIVRLAERGRREIRFQLDGRDAVALEGDTVLIAVLANADHVRRSEFGAQEPRAGFCLMGACQDCVIWTGEGKRIQACMTPIVANMAFWTQLPPVEGGADA